MKITGFFNRVVRDMKGDYELSFSIPRNNSYLAENIVSNIDKEKLLDITVKKHRQSRSLNANAYLWVLLGKLSYKLNTSKDEIYIEMLERYGVYTHMIVKEAVVDRIRDEWRTVRVLGEVKVNGTVGVQLQCYFGSSTYSTKEMAKLIDGVVSECKELDIETLPPHELERLKEEWSN